ncbi:MAG: NAD(+) diphosphatase [Nocardioidaceae bacterium]
MTPGPLPQFPFHHSAHDRLAERRSDPEFLAAAWADDSTRVLAVRDGALATTPDHDALRLVSPTDAPAGQRMLLGAVDGVTHFLVLEGSGSAESSTAYGGHGAPAAGEHFAPLRRLASRLDDVQASLAVHATSLAAWHARHPKCSVCGADTEIAEAGAIRYCPSCSTQHFPRTDPAVIMLVVDADDRCLLGHNAARDEAWYSTLAGFVEPGESPEEAVVREVSEETGVDVDGVTYAGSQPWPFPSQLMLGYFATASGTEITVDGHEITQARWFTRAELREEIEAERLVVPSGVSISGALLAAWYGAELPH